MKSLIIPITIIVGLIVFFFFVDRKEFNRHDTDQNVPTESRTPHSAHHIDYQHIRETGGVTPEITPTESKPVAEAKATEHQSGESPSTAKSLEAVTELKPAEGKPAQTILVTETAGKPLPAAVSLVTPEEAEKLNIEAIEEKEPFYRLYQNSQFETICFEGTIRATSIIPDPAKNDYDNCLYALFLEIDSLLSTSSNAEISCEVILCCPIMKNKIILQNNVFRPGDKVWCSCAEYDTMPQAVQEIQLSDDIQSYEHQQYYPIEIRKIAAFQKGGNRNFAKREITFFPIQTLPRDEQARCTRKERIQNEIARIEEEIKLHGGSFDKWKKEYKSIDEKYRKLCNEEYKGWIGNSFFAAGGAETTDYKTKEFITSILPYNDYLQKNNIDLIILRIPSKWDFAARVLGADDFQENPAWVEHYYECLKNGIEIIDPMPDMYKERFSCPLFYYYHIANEIHPCEGMSFVSSKVVSSVLKRYSYEEETQPITLKEQSIVSTSPREFYPEGNILFSPTQNITYKTTYIDETPVFAKPNTGSPFLCISNSLFITPSRGSGACIPAYMAYHLNTVPDHLFQAGESNGMLRTLVSNSMLLSYRKAIIMGEGDFMWGSFPVFPKYLVDKPSKISLEKTIDFSSDEITTENKDKYALSSNNGSLVIEEGNPSDITFSTTIPAIKGKATCLIRIIFEQYATTYMSITDASDNSIIEPARGVDYNSKTIDFYCAANKSRTIRIHLHCSNSDSKGLSVGIREISKIELWYY